MKLKKFTQVETHDLINDLNKYWRLCAEITEIAKFRIEEAYAAHTRDFKWSWKQPFTHRIKSVEDLTYRICGGRFRSVHEKFIVDKGFTTTLSCWFGDANGDYAFVQKHYEDITVAAATIGYWKHDHIGVFHELVEKYAEHPLVPDASDIQLIISVRSRLEKLQTYLDAYHNAI